MSRIDTIFSSGHKAIMPFIVAGSPNIAVTEATIIALDSAGADIIEIGFPFSDPIADGPVIAASMHCALESGVTPAHAIGVVSRIREQVQAGLMAMVSYSIVRKSAGTDFIDRLAEAGFDGVIIPDIDTPEAEILSGYCANIDFAFSMLVAPTTPLPRIKKLASLSSGFLYVLARTGLTGEQSETPDVSARIAEIRSVTSLPLAVGFGISTAEHVAVVHQSADAAIVGSALVRRMEASDDPALAAGNFVKEITP
ncbi:MAG: tryptophan synthase subunit alpha [Phycisphaerae bacterium]|nr:tryptophan synthase subunit alpha [Phycisphaerae bacterium]